MKIYFFLKNIPEFKGMSKSEMKKIWFACYLKTFRHWQQWVALTLFLLFIFRSYLFNSSPLILDILTFGILGLALRETAIYLVRPYIRKMLNET